MNTGICYTQSGSTKKYEYGLFSFSPYRVKFVGIDNYFVKPFIPYLFTSSNHPPEVSLEEGTVMYVVGLRNIDDSSIDLSTYLSYTPPDGYELVSEDHKYDTGVEEHYVSKAFYITEPITAYYGTAGKTITDLYLNAGKDFYYKKKDKPSQTTDIRYPVTISISGYTVHCSCERVTGIPGTNNGDFTLEVGIQLAYNNQYDSVHFKWQMKNGINEYKNVKYPYIQSSAFFTRNDWEVINSDGNKTHYIFVLIIK